MQQWCRWSTSASFPMIVSSSTVTSAKLRNEKKTVQNSKLRYELLYSSYFASHSSNFESGRASALLGKVIFTEISSSACSYLLKLVGLVVINNSSQ